MPKERWTPVARVEDLAEGVPVSVEIGEKKVLLVRLKDGIHACSNKCTHYGAPLDEGLLVGHEVTCPWHNARFDVRTGGMTSPPALDGLGCYPVKVEDGQVYLGRVAKPEPARAAAADNRTFVIIGAGAAGNAAAETLRKEGFAGVILLITAEAHGPYDRPTLSKEFLAGKAKSELLPLRSPAFYERHGIELITKRRVVALDPAGHTISFADGGTLAYDRALCATGGVPRGLDVPGSDLDGLFMLRSMKEADAIAKALADAESVAIVGAGFMGLEAASSIKERGLDVHVVAPEEVPMARIFGERVGRWLRQVHEDKGTVFHLGTTAERFLGDGRVREVVLKDGSRLRADLVLLALGVRPAVDYLGDSDLVKDGAVPVDGTLKTAADDVFAAGDIAVVPDARTGESYRVEHWIVAERQGLHAARAMLGGKAVYEEVPFFWTRQCGMSLKYVGHAVACERIAFRGSVEEGDFLAGYYSEGRLRAVAAAGRAQEAIAAGECLRTGVNVSFEQFEDPGTDLLGLVHGE